MNDTLRRQRIEAGLNARHRSERLFRLAGFGAMLLGTVFLVVLLFFITSTGLSAFQQTMVNLEVTAAPTGGDYHGMVKTALRNAFPEASTRREKKDLYALVSTGAAYELRNYLARNLEVAGQTFSIWLPASDEVDMVVKGNISRDARPEVRRLNDRQLATMDRLIAQGRIETQFNTGLFLNGDSREPELSGIAAAAMGSFFSLAVCLLLAFPMGVMAAIYLEEFAPKNPLSEFIEVNINNLAAVPSIVFGLLGLAIFLNFFELPRSAPLVGGMVLALMTLPTIIIAGRASLNAVPPSIREAALAVGASKVQTVFHHVLPLAMPGVLTGTIIGMARAVGETAPLLMIGMVAFVVDVPKSILDPATALPVQVFLWADSPERAFEERTAATILVLIVFLMTMNVLAVVLRRKFETRW